MKLACCDHSFPLLPHDDVCDLVRLLGFDAIDLALWGGHSHIRPERVRTDVAGWSARLRDRVTRRRLEVADLFLIPDVDYATMAVNHPSAAERARGRELFEQMLELAVGLEAGGITLLPGLEFEGEPHERSLERAAEELRARVAAGAAAGVAVSVEPHVGSLIASPADALLLLDATPGLEVTLDYSHFVLQGHPPEQLDPLLPRVRHVHARAARTQRLQVALRENAIDFERAVRVLRAAGFEGAVATEYLWIDQEGLNECDTLSETILMRDLLRTSLEAGDMIVRR